MKVVILKSQAKQLGGLEKTASRIASAFVQHGAEVSIITTAGGNPNFPPHIKIHEMQTTRLFSLLRIRQFDKQVQRWLQDNPADVVLGMDRNRYQTHIRAGNGVHRAYLKSRIYPEGRLKYCACFLNPLHNQILRLEKQAFENPGLKTIFANSNMVKQEIIEHYAVDPAKIAVIHNGVEWEEMGDDFAKWPEQKMHHCKTLGLDPDQLHLLFIGNGYMRKGLGQLLKALSKLERKDVHLTVIGKDRSQQKYEAMAAKLRLGSQVRFLGVQRDLRAYYQFADVLAIPSFYDPFANVTLESLAMGLFVLSSKSNGGSEILTEQTGLIIEDLESIDSITHTLEQALQHRKTPQTALQRRHSIKHLDYSKQMNQLIESCFA